MFQAFERAGRTAVMAGIAAVLMLLPPAAGPGNARSDDGAPLQLAQYFRKGKNRVNNTILLREATRAK